MCGIAGGIGPSAPNKLLLDNQLNSINHRGPDDQGTYVNQGIALGMCRLAIVEIADGKQPASDARESIHLVFNGEIIIIVSFAKSLHQVEFTVEIQVNLK